MPRIGKLDQCKIYKVISLNNPELVYYGHTCQTLAQRFCQHKSPNNKSRSKEIIKKGDAVILLVEDYPCESENEAAVRESFYIINNICVNKQIPGKSIEKKKEDKREYYEKNIDELTEYHKEYYKTNIQEISDKKKKYYEANKEEIKDQVFIYRSLHKEEAKEYRMSRKEETKEYNKQYRLKKKLEKNNILI